MGFFSSLLNRAEHPIDAVIHPLTDPRLLNPPDWAPASPTEVFDTGGGAMGGLVYADATGRLYRGPEFADTYAALAAGQPGGTDWMPSGRGGGYVTKDKVTSGNRDDVGSVLENAATKSFRDLEKMVLWGGGILLGAYALSVFLKSKRGA